MSKNAHVLKTGQIVELPIRRLGINGEGIGYYQKQVVFVDNAIPGEVVIARICEVNKNFSKANLVRIKKKSAYRTEPKCPIYSTCGGCQLQHIHYRFQRRLKRELVEESFKKYTSLNSIPIEPIVSMEKPWNYRNKAQLPLKQIGKKVAMGMFSAKSHRLVQIDDCLIQHPLVNQVLHKVRKMIEYLKIPIYNERRHHGVLRHLVARISFATEEIQLVLVTLTPSFAQEKELIKLVTSQIPQVKSIILNHNPSKTSLVFGEQSRLLWGKEKLTEKLGNLTYSLSPRAFFQLNPIQTVHLYNTIKQLAQLTGKETVIDAYCGVGSIGLWLADSAAQVIGMDTIPEAIKDAEENARINGYHHTKYYVGKAELLLPKWLRQGLKPDVIILDPPRTGLEHSLIEMLLQIRIPRIVYVSCNPSTLAKDCSQLIKNGYQIKKVIPFDMFPQTSHIECVTLLEKSG
jgi:23S rRNA (uracil-5-)-methyltransferase RumA